jgi:hypothetical protein
MTSYESFGVPHLPNLTMVTDKHGVRANIADFELQKQDHAYMARGVA